MIENSNEGGAKKKSLGKKIAIGVAIFFGCLAVLGVIIGYTVFRTTESVVGVVKEQLTAMSSGNYEKAYEYTSLSFQENYSYDEFVFFVELSQVLYKNSDSSFGSREIIGNEAFLKGSLTSDSGMVLPAEFQLIKENREWKIINIDIMPAGTEHSNILPEEAGADITFSGSFLKDTEVGSEVDENGDIETQTTVFTSTDTIYLNGEVQNVIYGMTLKANMYNNDGYSSRRVLDYDYNRTADLYGFSFLEEEGFVLGEYKIDIMLFEEGDDMPIAIESVAVIVE